MLFFFLILVPFVIFFHLHCLAVSSHFIDISSTDVCFLLNMMELYGTSPCGAQSAKKLTNKLILTQQQCLFPEITIC